jgi:hypothetical protein
MPIGVSLAATALVATVHLPPATIAAGHEASGQWEAALDIYLSLHETNRGAIPDLQARIHRCVRNAAQFRRHRDPDFHQYILSLTLADALAVYSEVLEKLNRLYADADRATPMRLFDSGKDEFGRAVANPAYIGRHLLGADPDKLRTVKTMLLTVRVNPQATVRDVRVSVREIALSVRTSIPNADPSAIVLEFLCGACAGLDEYTAFHPPGAYPKPMTKPTVIGEEMVSEQHGVGYLRISEFQENTSREFDAAVSRLRMRGMRALVIDLRGNPGGLLLAGVELGRRLLPAGVIVQTAGQDPNLTNRVFTSESGPTAFELPLVLLVDAGTMSTAEVVASAIKDNARGSLVGTPTYGKGTVQSTQKLKNGEKSGRGGVLIMTIAKSIAPNGRPMASVVPDILERDPELQMKAAVAQATAMASMGRPMSMMP